MFNSSKNKIAIIGCGNVAWHIASKLHHQKNSVLFIYNHKANKELARFKKEFNAGVFPTIKTIIKDASVYFICVKDNSILSVISTMAYLPKNSIVLITSGSFDISSSTTKLKNLCVFYPLQTFTKKDEVKWKDITLIIDPKNKTVEQKALTVAHYFTKSILHLNYQQRLKLHLAAVLANNFTNSLYVEADKILRSIHKDLNYKILLPLIKQSIKKLKSITPREAQTGPAQRNDKKVLQSHLGLIQKNKKLKDLYLLFSNLISDQQK